MMCGCESCQPSKPAPTYARAHMLTCEARFAIAMPDAARLAYLAEVERRRGAAGKKRLRDEMVRLYRGEIS